MSLLLATPAIFHKTAGGGGGGGSLAFLGMQTDNAAGADSTHDFSLTNGKKYAVMVFGRGDTLSSITTSDTDTVTLRGTGFSGAGSASMSGRFADFTASSTGTVTLTVTMSGGGIRFVALWELPSTSHAYITEATDTNTNTTNSRAALDINTNSGDIVLGGSVLETGSNGTFSVNAGFDQIDGDVISASNAADASAASAASAAGDTPEAFSIDWSGSFNQGGGISVVYRA